MVLIDVRVVINIWFAFFRNNNYLQFTEHTDNIKFLTKFSIILYIFSVFSH